MIMIMLSYETAERSLIVFICLCMAGLGALLLTSNCVYLQVVLPFR